MTFTNPVWWRIWLLCIQRTDRCSMEEWGLDQPLQQLCGAASSTFMFIEVINSNSKYYSTSKLATCRTIEFKFQVHTSDTVWVSRIWSYLKCLWKSWANNKYVFCKLWLCPYFPILLLRYSAKWLIYRYLSRVLSCRIGSLWWRPLSLLACSLMKV